MSDKNRDEDGSTTPRRSRRRRRRSTSSEAEAEATNNGSNTPKRSRRRRHRRSTSSEAEEVTTKKTKSTEGLTAEDLLKIISALQNNSSKNTSSTNVVPEFDPDNKSQDVQRWLKKVNECSVIYGWDEKQTIHYALQKLCGLAKRWYEALPSLDFSWEEWQAKLTKAFPNDVNYGKILEEMLNRKSRTDETLRDYFYDKLTLLSRCEIVGRKAVDCIIYGLADSAIRNGAQALKCEEPEDLLNYLASQQPSQLKDLRGNAAVGFTKRRDFRSSSNNQSRTSTSGRQVFL
ncbi:uncharacterized protein LOC119694739 [Plutella xylostella]|uniref:uncharacterized protein LOC119694739 n=1 Tax=Plutella xylostella TaxID=51655 RepID=UPI002032DE34|nr:uncharacterized protein LOC119694739 [Plutella xylostella]